MIPRRHAFGSASPKPPDTLTPAPRPQPGATQIGIGHDLACAILLGIVEARGVTVTLDAITAQHPGTGHAVTQRGWLRTGDLIGQLTQECIQAKIKMSNVSISASNTPWEKAKAIRTRDESGAVFRQAWQQVVELLRERGALAEAQRQGMRVFVEA